ncbi:putative abhydrolase domain-containing protein [Abeliophyllum distichum]|uniref:Abhydrolase domain-containing protein n=1 Tax=Abeliophyllum distichum TaxID=126358 RepID=A0ABD1RH68_9LAMI
MSSSTTGGDAIRRVGDEASLPVSPCMEGVLPIRGVDGSTGEAILIHTAPSLNGVDDPYRADVVRWAALDVPSIMVEEDLTKLREAYRIPADIERACFPRRRCCPQWMESNGGGYVFVVSAFFRHGDAFTCVPNHLSAEEVAEEEGQGGGSRVRVFDDPEPDLDIPSVYGIANSLPCCELSRDIVDVLRSIYQVDQKTQSYGLILNKHRCLVELGYQASKAKMDQGRCPRPTLARLTKQRPKVLVPGSTEDTSQRNIIEDLSKEGNKEAVEASKVIDVDDAPEGEVPLSRKRKARALGTGTSQARGSAVEVVDNYTVCSAPPFRGRWLSIHRERWFSRAFPDRLKPWEVEMGGHMTRRGS